MPGVIESKDLPKITSCSQQLDQQLDLPSVSSQSHTAESGLLPQSTSSQRPGLSLPTQQHDEHLPHVDSRPLDRDLQGIGVSLKIEREEYCSQIYLRSAGHWKPVGSPTDECELTIEFEVNVSTQKDHGRFTSLELRVQLRDIPDKGEQHFVESGVVYGTIIRIKACIVNQRVPF
jgi:hypothetical protein